MTRAARQREGATAETTNRRDRCPATGYDTRRSLPANEQDGRKDGRGIDLSRTCPPGSFPSLRSRCLPGFAAKAHTGFEPLPPGTTGRDAPRHSTTETPVIRGFLLLRRDTARHLATGRDRSRQQCSVQNLSTAGGLLCSCARPSVVLGAKRTTAHCPPVLLRQTARRQSLDGVAPLGACA